MLINVPSSGKLSTSDGGLSWNSDACAQFDVWVATASANSTVADVWPQLMQKYVYAAKAPCRTLQGGALHATRRGFACSKGGLYMGCSEGGLRFFFKCADVRSILIVLIWLISKGTH